jgi:conjugative transfer signal peptidase TraF
VLLWNVTASSPRGLYLVVRPISLRTGDMVAAWPPGRARRLAAARHYVPSRVPLLKRVEATAGDRICAWGSSVFVNGTKAAVRRRADRLRRPLHWWTGCRRLEPGELFLLSAQSPEAFDGRYFGVTRPSQVVGEARLLWAR